MPRCDRWRRRASARYPRGRCLAPYRWHTFPVRENRFVELLRLLSVCSRRKFFLRGNVAYSKCPRDFVNEVTDCAISPHKVSLRKSVDRMCALAKHAPDAVFQSIWTRRSTVHRCEKRGRVFKHRFSRPRKRISREMKSDYKREHCRGRE